MLYVNGSGWISVRGYGNSRGLIETFEDRSGISCSSAKKVLTRKHAHFNSLSKTSKMACISAELALKDAGIALHEKKIPVAVIGFGTEGSYTDDVRYYSDFIEFNKTGGRGNLFVYTLPTAPLADAAIHFGLTGPLFYFSENSMMDDIKNLLDNMISCGEASGILLGRFRTEECVFLYLSAHKSGLMPENIDFENPCPAFQ